MCCWTDRQETPQQGWSPESLVGTSGCVPSPMVAYAKSTSQGAVRGGCHKVRKKARERDLKKPGLPCNSHLKYSAWRDLTHPSGLTLASYKGDMPNDLITSH